MDNVYRGGGQDIQGRWARYIEEVGNVNRGGGQVYRGGGQGI